MVIKPEDLYVFIPIVKIYFCSHLCNRTIGNNLPFLPSYTSRPEATAAAAKPIPPNFQRRLQITNTFTSKCLAHCDVRQPAPGFVYAYVHPHVDAVVFAE